MTAKESKMQKLALWWLRRTGSIENVEVLTGDIIERFREGETHGWFWKQVLVAFIFGVVDGRRNRLGIILQACMLFIAVAWMFLFCISLPLGLSAIGLIDCIQLGWMSLLVISIFIARAHPLRLVALCLGAELLWLSSNLIRLDLSSIFSHGVLATRMLIVLLGMSLAHWAIMKRHDSKMKLDPTHSS